MYINTHVQLHNRPFVHFELKDFTSFVRLGVSSCTSSSREDFTSANFELLMTRAQLEKLRHEITAFLELPPVPEGVAVEEAVFDRAVASAPCDTAREAA